MFAIAGTRAFLFLVASTVKPRRDSCWHCRPLPPISPRSRRLRGVGCIVSNRLMRLGCMPPTCLIVMLDAMRRAALTAPRQRAHAHKYIQQPFGHNQMQRSEKPAQADEHPRRQKHQGLNRCTEESPVRSRSESESLLGVGLATIAPPTVGMRPKVRNRVRVHR